MTTGAFVMAGMALVRMGRFADAERHLDRAEEALREGADPGTEVLLHHARGMLRFGEGRFEEALGEFARAQRLERLLAGEHVLTVDVRSRALQVRVRMGDTGAVRVRSPVRARKQRNRAGMRIALAALELAAGRPGTGGRGAGAGDRRFGAGAVRAVGARRGAAARRDGSRSSRRPARGRGVARSGARARRARRPGPALHALAEPRAARAPSRTSHRPRCADLDDPRRAGRARRSSSRIGTVAEELSDAELRVVGYLPSNLTAAEIASELVVSTNTVRTHMRHIYAKLDAHTRSEAVARARELGLVAPGAARG